MSGGNLGAGCDWETNQGRSMLSRILCSLCNLLFSVASVASNKAYIINKKKHMWNWLLHKQFILWDFPYMYACTVGAQCQSLYQTLLWYSMPSASYHFHLKHAKYAKCNCKIYWRPIPPAMIPNQWSARNELSYHLYYWQSVADEIQCNNHITMYHAAVLYRNSHYRFCNDSHLIYWYAYIHTYIWYLYVYKTIYIYVCNLIS